MLEEVKENLRAVAEQSLCDAGYYSGEELTRAQEKGFEVLVQELNGAPEENSAQNAFITVDLYMMKRAGPRRF